MKKVFCLLLAALMAGAGFAQQGAAPRSTFTPAAQQQGSTARQGEEKRRVAVSVTGDAPEVAKRMFATELRKALQNSGRYTVAAREAAFLEQLKREQTYQEGGRVADAQKLESWVDQYGVDVLCLGEINIAQGLNSATAQLLLLRKNIYVGEIVSEYDYSINLSGQVLVELCRKVAVARFGQGDRRGGSYAANMSGSSNAQRHPAEPEMVFVQGGTFWMGCTTEQQGDCDSDESPLHSVTVSSFQMGKYEVTQGQWKLIMGSNPSNFSKGDSYPVENVSWTDAQEFISRLNAATGKHYRLPTEAEWEFAARGGTKSQGYKYSGSHNLNNVGWFTDNSGSSTYAVGTKLPNELGLYDMSGNVWEWCSDWYGAYSASAQHDPMGASSGSYRVDRGGGWGSSAKGCRVAFRDRSTPGYRYNGLGFRLVLP